MTRERPDPGYYIRQHLEQRGWTPSDLAKAMHHPLREINEIIAGYRDITPEIATGLSRAFDTTPQFWLNQQMAWDLLQTAADD
jgi:addiction module HigA family antidote